MTADRETRLKRLHEMDSEINNPEWRIGIVTKNKEQTDEPEVLNVEGEPAIVAPMEPVPQEHIDRLTGKKPSKELVEAVRGLDMKMAESGATVTITGPEGRVAKLGKGGGESKQLDLEGNEARYPIEHEVKVTVTHKFESGAAKLSISEKALEKWQEDDGSIIGLVKTKLRVSPSVEGPQWERLCEEFAERVEEEML